MECRKRVVAGKLTPLDGAGVDSVCLLPENVLRHAGADTVAAIVAPEGSGTGRMGTRGARAPPFHFA